MIGRPERSVEGAIKVLRCDSCGATFPHFVFFGEKDTDTDCLCSASSCERNEVVLVETESDEWGELQRSIALTVERRLSALLGRNDLKVPQVLTAEKSSTPAAGMSFRDFRKAYKPPALIYTCICCESGKSRSIEEFTTRDFQQSGGVVTPTGRLYLQATS